MRQDRREKTNRKREFLSGFQDPDLGCGDVRLHAYALNGYILSTSQVANVQTHLRGCSKCQQELNKLRREQRSAQ